MVVSCVYFSYVPTGERLILVCEPLSNNKIPDTRYHILIRASKPPNASIWEHFWASYLCQFISVSRDFGEAKFTFPRKIAIIHPPFRRSTSPFLQIIANFDTFMCRTSKWNRESYYRCCDEYGVVIVFRESWIRPGRLFPKTLTATIWPIKTYVICWQHRFFNNDAPTIYGPYVQRRGW